MRIGRYVFHSCAFLSLLLCVATVALWVHAAVPLLVTRTYWTRVGPTGQSGYRYTTVPGCFTLSIDRYAFPEAGRSAYIRAGSSGHVEPYVFRQEIPAAPFQDPRFPRFAARTEVWQGKWNIPGLTESRWFVMAPFWFPAALFAVLPVIWGMAALRRRTAPVGNVCRSCGYDLRATPERCPECGLAPAGVEPRRSGRG
jgi:hypothetical protein